MTTIETDSLGRPVLDKQQSQLRAFNRLLLSAKDPDDWDGPLGAAAEIALTLDDTHLLMLVGHRADILAHRDLIARGIDPERTEDDIEKEWFGELEDF